MVPCEEAVASYARQKAFYRCVAKLADNWPVDVHKDREYIPRVRERKVGVLVDPDRPHEPWMLADGRGCCSRCGCSSRSAKKSAPTRFFREPCNLGRERAGGFATRHSAISRTRLALERRGAVRMEARAGKRKAVEEIHLVDPRLSFKIDFESVLDTRADGLNPPLGGELWVNPKAGVINVRRRDRGFTLCSGLRGRRADLCIEDRCLTLQGLFQVTLRVAKDAGRLRDALLRMEESPPLLPAPEEPATDAVGGRWRRRTGAGLGAVW